MQDVLQQNVAQSQRHVEESKRLLEQLPAAVEMANHSAPILAKLEAMDKRIAELELELQQQGREGCCTIL